MQREWVAVRRHLSDTLLTSVRSLRESGPCQTLAKLGRFNSSSRDSLAADD
jgi:hypothetical protein